MNYSRPLFEMLLTEAVALTKGSQRVMNDKNLVANLADAIRDDARSHPAFFPPGAGRAWQKVPDQQLAQWFLENIDKIEKTGYEGVIYSRDGVYSDWIVRRYIAGSHNWEDLTGVMNMNIRDWTLLKNRNMLDPNHKDLPKFNSVRDLGHYMTTHYSDKLEDIRDAAKKAARNKMSKSIKLVDNDDYRIYTVLNRAASCALGLGTQWCTANSQTDTHYHNYSSRAMLFQLFPYAKEKDEDGNLVNVKDEDGKNVLNQKEKYQFDAGNESYGANFMNITDNPANPREISEKYPFLYTDLASALKSKKKDMEKAFEELSIDPTLQEKDFKIKTYEIDEEIKKLHKFVDRGYFTDESRKKQKSSADSGEETPVELPPQEPPVQEEEEMDPAAMATGGDIGTMGGGAGPTGGGKYPPGTAPTMPESFNHKGNITMEEVDKDVAAMLTSLKKYDMLAESVAPVLGMQTLGEKAKAKEVEEKEEVDEEKEENPWEKLGADKDAEKKPGEKSKTHKGGEVTKTEKGIVHKGTYGSEKGKKVDEAVEEADADILAWMNRFSKLGNMKGYGK